MVDPVNTGLAGTVAGFWMIALTRWQKIRMIGSVVWQMRATLKDGREKMM